jgi:hypothetical protein
MLIINQAIVLDPVETSQDSDQPMIGWHNLVTAANIAAGTTATGYPISNVANALTKRFWRAANTTLQYITITLDGVTPIDYVGIAGHNLGTAGIQPTIEGFISGVWTPLAGPVLPGNNAALLFRFALRAMTAIRIKLAAGSAAAQIAVIHVGRLLIMQRRIYAGHVPLTHARKAEFAGGLSQSGQYLGQVQLRSWLESVAPFRHLTPEWSRANLIPFLARGRGTPFFFAWRPYSYPYEVGYAWLTNDPMPTPQQSDGNLTAVDLNFEGIA